MRLRAEFTRPESVGFDPDGWIASPAGGVDRFMLDRIGDEVARATSLVRYAPDSRFPAHQHDLGEEFLVLEGVFSDDSGDYPIGSYVRNPPGTSHAPWTEPGCVIFVKLRQFVPGDSAQVVVTFDHSNWTENLASVTGAPTLHLHRFEQEQVDIMALASGESKQWAAPVGGVELLVFDGRATINGVICAKWHWFRFPQSTPVSIVSDGCVIYRKQGHLSAV